MRIETSQHATKLNEKTTKCDKYIMYLNASGTN